MKRIKKQTNSMHVAVDLADNTTFFPENLQNKRQNCLFLCSSLALAWINKMGTNKIYPGSIETMQIESRVSSMHRSIKQYDCVD